MSFLNSSFLIGLAGAAIPVVIHVLTRDRIRKVEFSTLRFFVRSSGKVLKRKRLQEMILLGLRMLLCALLALAFARPLFQQNTADEFGIVTARHARVVLVDVSASMAPQQDAARRGALDALDELRNGTDAAALVAFGTDQREIVALTNRVDLVQDAAGKLSIGSSGTDLVEALKQADKILANANAVEKSIVLISDMQRVGWRRFRGLWKLSPGVELHVRPLTPAGGAANVAIVEADFPRSQVLDGMPRSIATRVANFSEERLEQVDVVLTVNGTRAEAQKISLRPNDTVPVRFRHVFDTVGDNLGTVTVAGDDAIPADNTFHFNARVVPKIKILIISSKLGAGRFLKYALDPPGANSPFAATEITASRVTVDQIADAMVVIAADLNSVAEDVKTAMAALLERGGGLFFIPGSSVNADAFNNGFAGMLPAQLKQRLAPKTNAGHSDPVGLTKIDFDHPIFELFQRPHHGNLSHPRFQRYWEVSDSQLSRVLARFDDGRPALLERRFGNGTAIMLLSAVDGKWNNLPVESGAIFVSFVHQAMRHLAVRSEGRSTFTVGEEIPVPAGQTLVGPDGPMPENIGTRPGFYQTGDGAAEMRFAVNVDMLEADPTPLNLEEITAAVVPPSGSGRSVATAAAGTGLGPKDERNIWWYILFAGALLMLGELYLGNRTLRH